MFFVRLMKLQYGTSDCLVSHVNLLWQSYVRIQDIDVKEPE